MDTQENDYYMLREAAKGYLYIGSCLSRSLKEADTTGISLIYDKSPYILADKGNNIADDIAICKSNSAVNGAPLAAAHIRLGKKLGEDMREKSYHTLIVQLSYLNEADDSLVTVYIQASEVLSTALILNMMNCQISSKALLLLLTA